MQEIGNFRIVNVLKIILIASQVLYKLSFSLIILLRLSKKCFSAECDYKWKWKREFRDTLFQIPSIFFPPFATPTMQSPWIAIYIGSRQERQIFGLVEETTILGYKIYVAWLFLNLQRHFCGFVAVGYSHSVFVSCEICFQRQREIGIRRSHLALKRAIKIFSSLYIFLPSAEKELPKKRLSFESQSAPRTTGTMDGKYNYVPLGSRKPCLYVRSWWPNLEWRMYNSNNLRYISDFLVRCNCVSLKMHKFLIINEF